MLRMNCKCQGKGATSSVSGIIMNFPDGHSFFHASTPLVTISYSTCPLKHHKIKRISPCCWFQPHEQPIWYQQHTSERLRSRSGFHSAPLEPHIKCGVCRWDKWHGQHFVQSHRTVKLNNLVKSQQLLNNLHNLNVNISQHILWLLKMSVILESWEELTNTWPRR